jgi:hypothetical protein
MSSLIYEGDSDKCDHYLLQGCLSRTAHNLMSSNSFVLFKNDTDMGFSDSPLIGKSIRNSFCSIVSEVKQLMNDVGHTEKEKKDVDSEEYHNVPLKNSGW